MVQLILDLTKKYSALFCVFTYCLFGPHAILAQTLNEVSKDSVEMKLTNAVLSGRFANVHSLLIMKENKLIYEKYFAGKDQRHGKKLGYINHDAEQLHDCRSISKTVVSACIGIALNNGFLENIDDPIKKYFPEIKDSLKAAVTIRQLLTMTSGFKWNEIGRYGNFFNPETQMDLRFDPVKYILNRKLISKPGSQWNYNGGNTQLLAAIIQRRTGLSIDQFAERFLFLPLGINKNEWIRLKLGKTPAAASGLRLTSRDMLKIGLLYLNKGIWNGKQLFDSAWADKSFKPMIAVPEMNRYKIYASGYGFHFWTYAYSFGGREIAIAEAKGNGGQSIFICPSLNLVMVTTGGNYNRPDPDPYRMLTEYILQLYTGE